MKRLTETESRKVVGGGWGWVLSWSIRCAKLRLVYEHSVYGSCRTRYGFVKCPICGKS